MLLSDDQIARRIREGSLVVEPFDEKCLTPNGLDLRVGDEAALILPGPEYSSRRIKVEGGLELPANSAALLLTLERLEMPRDLVAQVNLRSTFARLGFLIPGTVVDAGYKGRLTLQVHSPPCPTSLARGERLWHLLFFEAYPVAKAYKGRYQESDGLVEGVGKREPLR
jgi:dCTP deaminase